MRTILVSMEDDYSVGELKALAKSGGAEVIGILTQNNDKPTLLTYITVAATRSEIMSLTERLYIIEVPRSPVIAFSR